MTRRRRTTVGKRNRREGPDPLKDARRFVVDVVNDWSEGRGGERRFAMKRMGEAVKVARQHQLVDPYMLELAGFHG